MFSRLHKARELCRSLWLLCVCCLWLGGSATVAHAKDSTALGGSLLEQGEVAITVGGGFPDVLLQFDFANSKRVNLAMRARINYNLGFPFIGLHVFVSAPLRIALYQRAKWSVALQLEPGVWSGAGVYLGTSRPYGLNLGFMMGVSGIASYQVHAKVNLFFGLETQFVFGWEPEAVTLSSGVRSVFGLQVPIEAFFGVEYKLNENFSLFARVAFGPRIYSGNLGGFFSSFDVGGSATGRLWGGVVWRR